MWLGKIAIIMYLFAFGLLFSGYYIDSAFGVNLFSSVTFDSLDELIGKNKVNETISIDLIFGDFIAGVKVIFGVLTGDTISEAFSKIPNFNETWMLLSRFLFTISSTFLWAYIVTGRSL